MSATVFCVVILASMGAFVVAVGLLILIVRILLAIIRAGV